MTQKQLHDNAKEICILRAQVAKLKEILKELEWVEEGTPDGDIVYCPVCRCYQWHGHADDCRLKELEDS